MNKQRLESLFGKDLQTATPRMIGALLVLCLVGGTLAWLIKSL